MIQLKTSQIKGGNLSITTRESITLIGQRLRGLKTPRKGVVLGLWGEAGIGKTWTLERILQSTGFGHVKVNINIPLAALIRVLPRPKRLPIWAQRLLEKLERGEHVATSSISDALGALLRAQAPMILCFEDLHEASPERLELLLALSQLVLRSAGVAIVVTSRNAPPEPFEAFKLEPLTSAESKALLETQINADLPLQTSDWIYARARGNPLFTLEFLRFLTRDGYVWGDGSRWHWRVPPDDLMPVTVEALIEHLLDQSVHSGMVQDALEAKALLGLGVTQQLWAQVAGLTLEALLAAQHELEQHNLLVNLEFAHPLFAEVTLKRLTLERSQVLARRGLLALQDDPIAAAGFVENAGLEPEMALAWLKRAVESAKAQGNEVQAAQFQARGVVFAIGEERGRLAFEAVQHLQHVDLPEASRLADIALELHPHDKETILLRASLFATLGQGAQVDRVLERLPDSEKSGSDWLGVRIRMRMGQHDVVGVLKICQEHPELFESTKPEICNNIGWALTSCGESERARSLVQRVLAQPDLTLEQSVRLTNLAAVVCDNLGDLDAAQAYCTQAISLAHQAGRLHSAAVAHFNRALARQKNGFYQDVVPDVQEALNLWGQLGDARGCAQAQVVLAQELMRVAEYERAEELLLEARRTLEQIGNASRQIDLANVLCLLYLDWQTPHSHMLALKYVQSALAAARVHGNPVLLVRTLACAALVYALTGQGRRGLELIDEMKALLPSIDHNRLESEALFAEASTLEAVGRRDEAILLFGRSVQAPSGVESQQLHELELDRLTQDLERARVRLAWFEARGLKSAANRVRRYFPELDAVPSREVETSGLRLEVLGVMQIVDASGPKAMRGQKRKELLAYLLEARIGGRNEVRVFELLEFLYPEVSPDEAADSLKQLVFQIRSGFGASVILTTGNGYALGAIGSDAELFLEHSDTSLWRGAYLSDVGQGRDENVREALYQALRSSIAATLEREPKEAIRVGKILCEAEPYDLEALALTLRAFRANGDHRGLSRLFGIARSRLLEVAEVLPERWQDFLAAQSA